MLLLYTMSALSARRRHTKCSNARRAAISRACHHAGSSRTAHRMQIDSGATRDDANGQGCGSRVEAMTQVIDRPDIGVEGKLEFRSFNPWVFGKWKRED